MITGRIYAPKYKLWSQRLDGYGQEGSKFCSRVSKRCAVICQHDSSLTHSSHLGHFWLSVSLNISTKPVIVFSKTQEIDSMLLSCQSCEQLSAHSLLFEENAGLFNRSEDGFETLTLTFGGESTSK